MITIQEVHKYLNLVEIGMAKPILCPLDNQHTHIACNTKVIPGDHLEKKIKLVIKNFT